MTDEEKKEQGLESEGESTREEIKWEIEDSGLAEEESKPVAEVEVQLEEEEGEASPEASEEEDLPKPGPQIPESPSDPEVEAAKAEKKEAEIREQRVMAEPEVPESATEDEPGVEKPEDAVEAESVPAGGAKKEEEGEKEVGESSAAEKGAPEEPGVPESPPPPPERSVGYGEDWNWREVKSGFKPFVFDYMNQLYRFSKGKIDRVSNVNEMSGYFTYLAHYEEAPGLGLLTLNTEKKYAKVLARKNLEELGELTSEGVLNVYDSRKLEGGQISVFYEVLPRDKHVAINETYRSYNSGFIIHDTVSLLYGLLRRAGRGAHAFALHLPGSIVLVAGRNGDVHLTRRYTLVGEDEQAVIEGIHALSQDLTAMERNVGQRLERVEWIEGLAWDLDIPKPAVETPIVPWPLHRFNLDGQDVWSALPSAVSRSQNEAAIGPSEEKYLRPFERAEKYVWAVLLALALVAGVGVYSMMDLTRDMEASIQAMRNKMNAMEAQIQARKVEAEFSALEPTMELARKFRRAAVSPPYGEMWNYLAAIKPEEVRVDGLDFNYQPDTVQVRLEGEVQRDLTTAQYIYNSFLAELEQAGFEVAAQELDLDVEGNFYSVNLSWPLNRME